MFIISGILFLICSIYHILYITNQQKNATYIMC